MIISDEAARIGLWSGSEVVGSMDAQGRWDGPVTEVTPWHADVVLSLRRGKTDILKGSCRSHGDE